MRKGGREEDIQETRAERAKERETAEGRYTRKQCIAREWFGMCLIPTDTSQP